MRVSRSKCWVAFLYLGIYNYLKHGDFYDGGEFQAVKSAYNFQHNPVGLWVVQFNFAVLCATSGLGIPIEHLNAEHCMVKSLFLLCASHIERMQVPLPSEDSYDKYNNAFIPSRLAD